MKAAVINDFGGPEVFEIWEIDKPGIRENELLIEVHGGSLNAIDWKQRKGNHKFIFGAPFPIVLGYDVSGIVVDTGAKIHNFKIGDQVCGVLSNTYGGGLGQFARGKESCFALLDPSIPLTESAALPLAGLTALQVLRDKAKLREGKSLLLIGAAGGVGHFALQIAAIFGAEIHAVSSKKHKKFIEKLSACRFIDYTEQNIGELPERFDVIFDTIGKYPFPKFKHLLNPGGIHINILPRPNIIWYKILSVITRRKKARTHLMKHDPNDLNLLVKWTAEGKLKPAINRQFSLEEISDAHAYMEEGHTEGKILIRYK